MSGRLCTTLILTTLFACDGGAASVPDSGDGTDAGDESAVEAGPDNGTKSDTYPAFTIDAPQILNPKSGPVLAAPKVIPVYFANDDSTFTAALTKFVDALATSTYWGPQVAEYGVGQLTAAAPVQLTENAPATISSSDIHTWVASEITNNPAFPQPDANTIYSIFYPSTTTITSSSGATSCLDYAAFHSTAVVGSTDVAYTVSPRCSSFFGGIDGPALGGVDAVTAPTSHELVEAANDPLTIINRAFGTPDTAHAYWPLLTDGVETGDYCYLFSSTYFKPTDVGFTVARTWSNVAAKAGHDPCVAADGSAYFNAMPVMLDDVVVQSGSGNATAKGVHVPAGESATIEIDLFSDAPTSGPWTVNAIDAATFGLVAGNPTLSFTFDRKQGQNGEKLHLTIHAAAKSQAGWQGFVLESALGTRRNYWMGVVGN